MAILAGVDEAGFGPVLGPLVVSAAAFRVPDNQANACLWEMLQATCAPRTAGCGHRLVIADSKQLYRSREGLSALERAALVMLAVAEHRPPTWRALLDTIAPHAAEQLDQYPWYTGRDVPLPVSAMVGDTGTRANAVRRDCGAHHVSLLGVFSEPLAEGHFNRLVAATRNKGAVLIYLVLRVVDRILRAAPGERMLRILVDRLGGRAHYRDALMTALPEYELRILEESADQSVYRLTAPPRTLEIAFATGGDSRHFPVALASIYSKYVRELYMHAFNAYWCARATGLTPTAGYYTDAQRWLQEAASTIEDCGVARDMLVRSR